MVSSFSSSSILLYRSLSSGVGLSITDPFVKSCIALSKAYADNREMLKQSINQIYYFLHLDDIN